VKLLLLLRPTVLVHQARYCPGNWQWWVNV
jgi:hypothetical protein